MQKNVKVKTNLQEQTFVLSGSPGKRGQAGPVHTRQELLLHKMEMLPRLSFHMKLLHYIFRRASHGFLVRGAVFFN